MNKFWNWLKNIKLSKKKKSQSMNLTESSRSIKQDLYQKKPISNEYYKSIYDCPAIRYYKALETGDSRHLYILSNYNDLPENRLDDVLNDIFWEAQEETGLDDNFKMSIEYKARIAELEFDEVSTGKGNKPRIEYYKSLLKGLNKSTGDFSFTKRLATLSKYTGYQIPLNITLYELIGIEKIYSEYAKSTANK